MKAPGQWERDASESRRKWRESHGHVEINVDYCTGIQQPASEHRAAQS